MDQDKSKSGRPTVHQLISWNSQSQQVADTVIEEYKQLDPIEQQKFETLLLLQYFASLEPGELLQTAQMAGLMAPKRGTEQFKRAEYNVLSSDSGLSLVANRDIIALCKGQEPTPSNVIRSAYMNWCLDDMDYFGISSTARDTILLSYLMEVGGSDKDILSQLLAGTKAVTSFIEALAKARNLKLMEHHRSYPHETIFELSDDEIRGVIEAGTKLGPRAYIRYFRYKVSVVVRSEGGELSGFYIDLPKSKLNLTTDRLAKVHKRASIRYAVVLLGYAGVHVTEKDEDPDYLNLGQAYDRAYPEPNNLTL